MHIAYPDCICGNRELHFALQLFLGVLLSELFLPDSYVSYFTDYKKKSLYGWANVIWKEGPRFVVADY